ncbi:hypothetical protein D3C81_1504410 [compost metagenome]
MQAQRPLHQLLVARLVDDVVLAHLPQHHVAALQRAFWIADRVVVIRALEHANQGGAFQDIEARRGLVEIGAGRHLDAVGVVQERHRIQIRFEDFRLAVGGLDLEGRDQLLQLAVQVARATDFFGEHIARELLRDGGTALGVTARRVQDGARRAREIDAVVVVETVVFRRDQCADHVRRNLF